MSRVYDDYRNAVCGMVIDVANRSWSDDGARLVTIRCQEPFDTIVVRAMVANWGDAMMLMERTVVLCDRHVYPLVGLL